MVKIYVERTINVPINQAWSILSDFSNVHKVHPLVGKVDQLSTNDRGLNAERTCHLYQGGNVSERIVDWDESARQYTIQLTKGTLPMKSVKATLKAADAGNGKSKLIGESGMIAKYGLLGKIMEHMVIKPQFGRAIGNLFAGVEHYVKTGEEVQKGFTASTPALIK